MGQAAVAWSLSGVLIGCGNSDPRARPTLHGVGEQLFHDPSLSASGRLACAGCHDPEHGHSAGTFSSGGINLDVRGLRTTPSLRYIDSAGAFRILTPEVAPDLGKGGYFWDGRVDSRAAQARRPLLGAAEMANPDVATLVSKIRARPYFEDLVAAASLGSGATDDEVLDAALRALEAYQTVDVEFHPFTSKYDAYLDGLAQLTPQEAHGLQLFEDPLVGACASCHPSAPGPDGSKPIFTKFLFFAMGAPRVANAQNLDPTFFDLGLCGPVRTDLVSRTGLCGMFRTPSLRNVALRGPYYHNGAFATLPEVVSFYRTRDTEPGRWYPTVDGAVEMFDDIPAAYRGNVAHVNPFGLEEGSPPRFTEQDADDIVAFLGTLSDGFRP